MTITRSTDHVERGQARLLHQLQLPKTKAWLATYLARIQELEDALWEIHDGRFLDDAVGYQLDVIGKLVGRGRNGLSDDHYRLAIRVQIRINRSQGRTIDMTAVAGLSVPAGTSVEIHESAIATIYVTVGPGDYDLATLISNLSNTRTLGVKLFLLIWYEDGASNAFTWAPVGGVPIADDPALQKGWAAVGGATGGLWSHLIHIAPEVA